MFASSEINLPILLLVAAADVARRQPAIVVPAAASLFYFNETLMRLRFRDFGESRKRLEPERRSKWTKTFESHNELDEVDLLALLERHDCLFPVRLAAEIGPAFALFLPGII